MTTLHIRNTVCDYDGWKAAFDRFDRFRADHGVRTYRIFRQLDDPQQVEVSLDFDSVEEARVFRARLDRIWASPQSRAELVDHEEPVFLELVEHRTLRGQAKANLSDASDEPNGRFPDTPGGTVET